MYVLIVDADDGHTPKVYGPFRDEDTAKSFGEALKDRLPMPDDLFFTVTPLLNFDDLAYTTVGE